MATPNLAFVVGMEAYSTKRVVPEQLARELNMPMESWNTILPINVGLQGKLGQRMLRPYLGGDVVLIPGLVRTPTTTESSDAEATDASATSSSGKASGVAFGGRARVGVDLLLTDRFGLNANAALGVWAGEAFSEVQNGLTSSGFAPQISGGTVIRF